MRKTCARDGAICLSSFICHVPELKLRGKLKANKERVATASRSRQVVMTGAQKIKTETC